MKGGSWPMSVVEERDALMECDIEQYLFRAEQDLVFWNWTVVPF